MPERTHPFELQDACFSTKGRTLFIGDKCFVPFKGCTTKRKKWKKRPKVFTAGIAGVSTHQSASSGWLAEAADIAGKRGIRLPENRLNPYDCRELSPGKEKVPSFPVLICCCIRNRLGTFHFPKTLQITITVVDAFSCFPDVLFSKSKKEVVVSHFPLREMYLFTWIFIKRVYLLMRADIGGDTGGDFN